MATSTLCEIVKARVQLKFLTYILMSDVSNEIGLRVEFYPYEPRLDACLSGRAVTLLRHDSDDDSDDELVKCQRFAFHSVFLLGHSTP